MKITKKVLLLCGRFPEKLSSGVLVSNIPECNPNHEKNWMGWTKKELEKKDFEVYCPIIPNIWKSKYEDWKNEIQKFRIDEDTVLVGLSAGGCAITRFIIEEKKCIKKLILIAPSKGGFKTNKMQDFYKFEIHKNVRNQIKNGTTIFYDKNDSIVSESEVNIYEKALAANMIYLSHRGHFSFTIQQFPELLEEILMAYS